MIINAFSNPSLFTDLIPYNKDIEDICSRYTYDNGPSGMDLNANRMSEWFDLKNLKNLLLSEFYPDKAPFQDDPAWLSKFPLHMYFPNYVSLFLIKILFPNPDVLIEDLAGGMGKFIYFLAKSGYKQFSLIDNFTQVTEGAARALFTHGNIDCSINTFSLNPKVVNLVGHPFYPHPRISEHLELLITYNRRDLVVQADGVLYLESMGKGTSINEYRKIEDLVYLCSDQDHLINCYCKKSKVEEFTMRLRPSLVSDSSFPVLVKNIPQYEPWVDDHTKNEIQKYVNKLGFLTEYKVNETFESQICQFLGVKYCSTVNNGTIGLSLALLAVGVKKGDYVAIPALTMVATMNAILLIGAIPILVDVDPETSCMSSISLEGLLQVSGKYEDKIRAIIYVSLNGRWDRTGELHRVVAKAKSKGIAFIEDAAQSFGSQVGETRIGNFADITSFSFSMPKIISCGQGGCLVTNDKNIAKRIKQLKNFGRSDSGGDEYSSFGINSKFTELQAATGIGQMVTIDERIAKKREIYKIYQRELEGRVNFLPTNLEEVVPWFIDIYFPDKMHKERVMGNLAKSRIGVRPIYTPLHQHSYIRNVEMHYKMSVSENLSSLGLWLPSSFNLTEDLIKYICYRIKEEL